MDRGLTGTRYCSEKLVSTAITLHRSRDGSCIALNQIFFPKNIASKNCIKTQDKNQTKIRVAYWHMIKKSAIFVDREIYIKMLLVVFFL